MDLRTIWEVTKNNFKFYEAILQDLVMCAIENGFRVRDVRERSNDDKAWHSYFHVHKDGLDCGANDKAEEDLKFEPEISGKGDK